MFVRVSHPDRRALAEAGWVRPLWQWELVRALCATSAMALLAMTPLPLVGAIAGIIGPSAVVRYRAEGARQRAARATTRLLRATEGALRSTMPLPEALRRASDATADVLARRPFVDALRAFDLGASLDEALRTSASLASDGRTRAALETLALGVASRLPHERAAQLVGSITDRLAFEERLADEVRARTSGLRSQVLLLALVVPAMALFLGLTVPSLATTLASPIGRYVLVPVSLGLEVVGIVLSRRLVRGVA
jgi:Flp pilus assembly protein TadB